FAFLRTARRCDHPGPCAGKGHRCRPADAGGGAGDEDHLAGKIAHGGCVPSPFIPPQPLPYAGKPGHPESGVDADILTMLERRLGRLHARQRLGIEREFEGKVFGRGLKLFHIENWYSAPTLIRTTLKATGLYARGRRNADRVLLRENPLSFADLPPAFDDFRILHLSDLHVEMSANAMERAAALAASTSY